MLDGRFLLHSVERAVLYCGRGEARAEAPGEVDVVVFAVDRQKGALTPVVSLVASFVGIVLCCS